MLARTTRAVAVVLWVCGALLAADSAGIWLDVPFVKQEKDGCGAASIAMVMQYWQQKQGQSEEPSSDAEHIQRVLFAESAGGILASDMERYFENNGYRVFAFHGEWSDLKQHLEKGRPLIVALRPGPSVPLHYVVVAGLGGEHELVLVNDPAQRKLLKEERSRFEKEWNAAGRWTLLAVPEAGSR